MFRAYDSDVTTWSPQGKLYQVEYAMNAVSQGSVCVGVRNKNFSLIASLKRTPGTLASYQQKIFEVDDHCGVAVAGLTADARVLTSHMRSECLSHKYVYESSMPMRRLVLELADKSQRRTQFYGKRPYGIGLLIAGYDETGAHLHETCPSGNYYEWEAQAIGSRSQSCRTFLEKKLSEEKEFKEQFDAFGEAELVQFVLEALRESIRVTEETEEKLTGKNVTVGIVGKDTPFKLLDEEVVDAALERLPERGRRGATADQGEQMDAS